MRSNRLSQSPEEVATPHRASDETARSYPQAGPTGNDRLHRDTIDDDQFLTAGRARDDLDVPSRDPEFIGQQPDQRGVGSAFDRRRHDLDFECAVHDVLDALDRGARGESDGEADAGGTQDRSDSTSLLDPGPVTRPR